MKNIVNNDKGFNLVEMMITAAIIGIVSMIAVPNVMLYRTRATQKEGMALLSSLYGNMKLTRAQIDRFPRDFVAAGFRPEGEISYRVEIATAAFAVPGAYYPDNWICDRTCFSTSVATCIVRSPMDGCLAGANSNGVVHHGIGSGWTEAPGVQTAPVGLCLPSTTENTFRACAGGNVGGNQVSVLTIDEGKNLQIVQDGTIN